MINSMNLNEFAKMIGISLPTYIDAAIKTLYEEPKMSKPEKTLTKDMIVQYVWTKPKNNPKRKKCGIMIAEYDGIGGTIIRWSKCNLKEDKFDREKGINIALNRKPCGPTPTIICQSLFQFRHKAGEHFAKKYQAPAKVIKIGQRYTKDNEEYILADVEGRRVTLICLEDGNRWTEPILVNRPSSISDDEFRAICGYRYGSFVLKEGK
jgi:hypothetical protein